MKMAEGAIAICGFVFNQFMSNIINDDIDISKGKIQQVIYDGLHQNLSSKIYHIIEDILIMITENKHNNPDILYEAIEKIIIEFQKGKSEYEAVKAGMSLLISDVSNTNCAYFLEKFDERICQDEELCRRRSLYLQKKQIRISKDSFRKIEEKVDLSNMEANKKLDILLKQESGRNMFTDKNDKKADYIKSWNSNLFPNDEENPKTLSDAFIMPDFYYKCRTDKMQFSEKRFNAVFCSLEKAFSTSGFHRIMRYTNIMHNQYIVCKYTAHTIY